MRILVVLTVAMMVAYVFAISLLARPVQAPTGHEFMRADPSIISRKDLLVGDTLTINITVGNMTRITTLSCSVNWDPYYLNFTSIVAGGCLPGGSLLIGDLSRTRGYIYDVTYGVLGTFYDISLGTAFKLTFKIMHPGCSTVDIWGMSCWDIDLHEVLLGDSPYDCRVCISEIRTFPIDWNDDTAVEFYVQTESNSTIQTPPQFNIGSGNGQIFFSVTGQTGSGGYANVTIPRALLDIQSPWVTWWVLIDSVNTTPFVLYPKNSTHTFICVPYTHSEHMIQILGNKFIPEFPSFLILLLFMIATLLIIIVYRRKTASYLK